MNKNFAQTLYNLALNSPQKVAIVIAQADKEDTALDYQSLYQNACRYATFFTNLGIRKGDILLLLLDHSIDLVFIYWGAVLAGAIPSIQPYLTEKLQPDVFIKELEALIEFTKPKLIITYDRFNDEILTNLPQVKTKVPVITSAFIAKSLSDITLTSYTGNECEPDDIAIIQHSSGTTGIKKGVALSHLAVFNQINAYSEAIKLCDSDVIVSWLPLYHDMGLIACFLLPILSGISLVLMSPFDWVKSPVKLLTLVTRYKGTLTWLPNFAFNFLSKKIREQELEQIDLQTLRAVINCSEPVRYESMQLFENRFKKYGLDPTSLSSCYAMAENVFCVSQSSLGEPPIVDWIDPLQVKKAAIAEYRLSGEGGISSVSSGKPLKNVQIKIVDSNFESLANRRIGEVAIQSDCLFTEYLNNPKATKDAFKEGWYLSGDYGYVVDGELFITGRKKDLIIVGGINIYPQDIEEVIAGIPGVYPGRVVAFGVPNESLGTEDVVVIAETEIQDSNLRANIADVIRKKVTQETTVALRKVYVVDHGWLIKTSSGKLSRSANRDKYLTTIRI